VRLALVAVADSRLHFDLVIADPRHPHWPDPKGRNEPEPQRAQSRPDRGISPGNPLDRLFGDDARRPVSEGPRMLEKPFEILAEAVCVEVAEAAHARVALDPFHHLALDHRDPLA
jgi:hypothetical protein